MAAPLNAPVEDAAPDLPAAVALAAGDVFSGGLSAGFSATGLVEVRAAADLGDDEEDGDEANGAVLLPEIFVPAAAPPVRAEASSALSRSMS